MARNNNLYLSALHRLRQEILNNKYPFNSKLPSEIELSEKLDISRSTLRKVLSTLKEEGLIEIRNGSGSFVCDKNISRYIPMIMPKNNKNYRYAEIYEGVNSYLSKIGFSALLTLTDEDLEKEKAVINSFIEKGHKNFIIYPSSCNRNAFYYQQLLRKGCNIVFVDTLPANLTCDHVTSCNFLGGYEATKKLIDLGHKNIAFCSLPHPKNTNTINDRFLGYISALKQQHLKLSNDMIFLNKSLPFEDFCDKVIENISSTAIFASTDELAVMLFKKFANSKKSPAIIGFDNTVLSESYGLASVNQNLYEIGRKAAKLLHERIINPSKSYEHIYVPIKLIERSSLYSEYFENK